MTLGPIQGFDNIIDLPAVIDVNSSEAFLVRREGDTGDVLTVNTLNSGGFTALTIQAGGAALVGASTDIRAIQANAEVSSGTNTGRLRAFQAQVTVSGNAVCSGGDGLNPRALHCGVTISTTGAVDIAEGCQTSVSSGGSGIAAGTITTATGQRARVGYAVGTTSGAITSAHAFLSDVPPQTSGTNTIGTYYSFKSENIVRTGITTAYAFYGTDGLFFHGGRIQGKKGADVASANNLTLSKDGNSFTITGTTQINAITTADWTAGSEVTLLFTGALTVKHNTAGGAGTAPILMIGSADITTAANTIMKLWYSGSNWYVTSLAAA